MFFPNPRISIHVQKGVSYSYPGRSVRTNKTAFSFYLTCIYVRAFWAGLADIKYPNSLSALLIALFDGKQARLTLCSSHHMAPFGKLHILNPGRETNLFTLLIYPGGKSFQKQTTIEASIK